MKAKEFIVEKKGSPIGTNSFAVPKLILSPWSVEKDDFGTPLPIYGGKKGLHNQVRGTRDEADSIPIFTNTYLNC